MKRSSLGPITLAQGVAQTEREWVGTRGEATARKNCSYVLDFLGGQTALTAITYRDCQAFATHRATQGDANSTINRKLSALSRVLTTAVKQGWITTRPPMPRLPESPGRVRVLTQEEEAQLLLLLTRWGAMDQREALAVLLDTGMRGGELWRLQRKDCNFTWTAPGHTQPTGLLHIWQTKTDQPRSLPMTARVHAILLARAARGEVLFPYTNNWFWRTWVRAKVQQGLAHDREYVPYACRHTCASRLLAGGLSIPELQAWLGHKTIQMTMRYAHLCPTALVKGAFILEAAHIGLVHIDNVVST